MEHFGSSEKVTLNEQKYPRIQNTCPLILYVATGFGSWQVCTRDESTVIWSAA